MISHNENNKDDLIATVAVVAIICSMIFLCYRSEYEQIRDICIEKTQAQTVEKLDFCNKFAEDATK